MITKADYDAMLAEAQDPATPATRLRAIMDITFEMRKRMMLWNGMVENMWTSGAPLERVLALNPNLDGPTISLLADFYPKIVLQNPLLPLLLLEGNWQGWKLWSMNHLRDAALEVNHALFPALTGICLPEWRKHDYVIPHLFKEDNCGGWYCARCSPQRVKDALVNWEYRREFVVSCT